MRALFDIVLCLLLLCVAALGALICFMGFEAVSTGANPGPWWASLLTLVVAPLLGVVLCVVRWAWRAAKSERGR